MSRVQRNALFAILLAAITAVNLSQCLERNRNPATNADQNAGYQGGTEVPLLEDLRTIPQDLTALANAFTATLDSKQEAQLRRQFQDQYFSPWTEATPRFSAELIEERYRQFAAGTWYGENRQRVEPERLRRLVALTDWAHFPSIHRPGVVVKPSLLRILPSIRPLYESPDDFPFDHLQFAEIKPQEPARILHTSLDGAWIYLETSTVSGWVKPDAVGFVGNDAQQRLRHIAPLVIVRDFATVRTEGGKVLAQAKIGTLYPLVAEEADHWLVEAATADADQQAIFTRARIAKEDARPHPLHFTPANLALIGNELLKTPYGWGEVFRDRDCSASMRDFFLSFGLWLPRNSHQQINSGPFLPLAGLSASDKERTIREQGIPFRTLLYLTGHIMLYVGPAEGKTLVLHTIWGQRYTNSDGANKKLIIGRTVVSSLELGKELPLTKGTLLERLEGMLVLPTAPELAGKQQPADAEETTEEPR
nr:NlpC/P60 family N-terminal domain-containing protein [uncultured Desulfobulbus sp.]